MERKLHVIGVEVQPIIDVILIDVVEKFYQHRSLSINHVCDYDFIHFYGVRKSWKFMQYL